jgi:hypothetical protein
LAQIWFSGIGVFSVMAHRGDWSKMKQDLQVKKGDRVSLLREKGFIVIFSLLIATFKPGNNHSTIE